MFKNNKIHISRYVKNARAFGVNRALHRSQYPMMVPGHQLYTCAVELGKESTRCNRLRCPLARMSGLQCFNMGHNGHVINLYGVSMTLMAN